MWLNDSASHSSEQLLNDEDAPPAASPGRGLANLRYWIDRRNGIAGFWGTQIFPFVVERVVVSN